MEFYERLEAYRKHLGVSQASIEKECGLSNGAISKWKNSVPKADSLQKVTDYLGVTLDYVMKGYDGTEMIVESNRLGTGVNTVELNDDSVQIRVLGKVAAGVPIEAVEDVIGEETISKKMSEAGDYFGLRISGDSMEPLIHHGAVVIVRQQNDLENGDIAIVMVNGNDATCKKIEKYENGIMLVPMNKAYKEKFYTNEEIENLPVRIIGKVVESRTKF